MREINKNMESMVATLAESVENIKEDLIKVEKVFDTKIKGLQENVDAVNRGLKNATEKIGSMDQESKNEKDVSQRRIKNIEADLEAVQKKHKIECDGLRRELRNFIADQSERMAQCELELEGVRNLTSESIDEVKLVASGNASDVRSLSSKVEMLDNKSRPRNIVMEGLPEGTDKSDKGELTKHIQKVIPEFTEANITSLYRVGKLKKERKKKEHRRNNNDETTVDSYVDEEGKSDANGQDNAIREEIRKTDNLAEKPEVKYKPRTMIVKLCSTEMRDLVLARATDIRANSGLNHLWINRDQNDNSRRKHQMVKACYGLLLDKKYACSMRGSVITYQGKQYDYERLNLLPESCTPYYVKTRETEDGEGLCFSSEHVYCSNLAPAIIKYEGNIYRSVEHAFQSKKVKDAGYIELAEEIRGIRNPYDAKRLGHSIQVKKSWKKKAGEIMDELIQLKFDQNPKLKEKLMETRYKKYYEMTVDKLWATGRTIYKADKQLPTESLAGGKNLVGKSIAKVKRGYIQDEIRLGLRQPEKLQGPDNSEKESSLSETSSETSENPTEGLSENGK